MVPINTYVSQALLINYGSNMDPIIYLLGCGVWLSNKMLLGQGLMFQPPKCQLVPGK